MAQVTDKKSHLRHSADLLRQNPGDLRHLPINLLQKP
jgi:hypothetical protein